MVGEVDAFVDGLVDGAGVGALASDVVSDTEGVGVGSIEEDESDSGDPQAVSTTTRKTPPNLIREGYSVVKPWAVPTRSRRALRH